MSRITENEVGNAVLRILATCPDGKATVTKLKIELPNHIRLSADDQVGSETRTNEELWEQQVRNLKSHSPTSGNIFHEGYVAQVTRGVWQITDAGRRRIAAAA
jgi:hypothetical protein